jgi:threonine dehydrogenase-like Zn-dependent dehydrogenase
LKALLFTDRIEFRKDYPDPSRSTGDVLIRVSLAGICATDLEIARGYMNFHGVPGHEFVGTVIEGASVWNGKRVVGEINCVCQKCDLCQAGLSNHCRKRTVLGIGGRDGTFAEYVTLPVRNLHEVPSGVSDEEAVFVEPLAAAIQVVKQCPIESRMRVAVVGSGRLGLLVAQVLARTGCRLEVVGRNPNTLLFCEKKGIQPISVNDLIPRADRDVVVDCSGTPQGFDLATQLVRPRGTIVLKSTYAGSEATNCAAIVINEIAVQGSRCGPFPDAIQALARKHIDVLSMISRTFDLSRGLEAFEAAQDPANIKILLKPRS